MSQYSKKKKKSKYKKAFKKGYMMANRMHLQQKPDELMDLEQRKRLETNQGGRNKRSGKIPSSDLSKQEKVRKLPNQEAVSHIRLVSNYGNINCELYCNLCPTTCHNFLKLCESGQYNGTIFHRLIPGFMVQGGKVKSETSAWGSSFKDEFHPKLTHNARGVISMANKGPGTNGSQFFICFKPTHHLDNKHSVFGRVVGGFNTIDNLEKFETGSNDRPNKKIVLLRTIVYSNPFNNV